MPSTAVARLTGGLQGSVDHVAGHWLDGSDSKQLGRASAYVSKYETDERKLRIGYFLKICDVLDLDARHEVMRAPRPEAFE